MLKDKISMVEKQMKVKLEEIRATFEHTGDKGTSVENVFRTFLRQYMPRRLEIGNGEIIDQNQHISKQTDIVIVNEDHPYTFTPDLPGLFFIEGVSAAGEVKTVLTSSELDNALKNSNQFKQLQIEPGQGTLRCTNPSNGERFYKCPPWFLIAFESQLTLSHIGNEIVQFGNRNSLSTYSLLDAVFVLGLGWVINFGDGKGSLQFRTPEGNLVEGWVSKTSDSVLFNFLGWLSIVMPRTFRFQSILPKYILPQWEK